MPCFFKEQENRDLLDQFRMVHSQAEEWEVKAQNALGESSSIKMELLSVDTDRRHLRERLEDLENEVQEVELINTFTFSYVLYIFRCVEEVFLFFKNSSIAAN